MCNIKHIWWCDDVIRHSLIVPPMLQCIPCTPVHDGTGPWNKWRELISKISIPSAGKKSITSRVDTETVHNIKVYFSLFIWGIWWDCEKWALHEEWLWRVALYRRGIISTFYCIWKNCLSLPLTLYRFIRCCIIGDFWNIVWNDNIKVHSKIQLDVGIFPQISNSLSDLTGL